MKNIDLIRLIDSKISLKVDFLFKMVFLEEVESLKDLIMAVLKITIEEIYIVSKDFSLNKYKRNSKSGVLDIAARLAEGSYINIEMQVRNEYNTLERLLFYESSLYTNTIKAGEDYSKTKKVIVIGILDYEIFNEEHSYISETDYKIIQSDEKGIVHEVANLNEKKKMYIIELPKFRRMKHDLNIKLEQWLVAIDNNNLEEMGEVMKKNRNIFNAIKKTMKLAEDETVSYIIDREEDDLRKANDMRNMYIEKGIEKGKEEGIKEGIKEGKKEGKKEEKIKIAKAMKKIGASIEEISICTELTKDEIEELDER